MKSQTLNWYLKFGVNPENGLTYQDKISVLFKLQPDINFNSDIPDKIISSLNCDIPSRKEWITAIKTILNPNNKAGASTRVVEYWIIRGWSHKAATEKISAYQRKLLPSCSEYYDGMGLSDIEIQNRISIAQSKAAKSFHEHRDESEFRRKNNVCNLSSEEQSIRGKIYADKVKSGEILCNLSKEYYKDKYGDSWESYYREFQEHRMKKCKYRSKSEDEFISHIASEFETESQYYGENQFGIMGNDGYCKYDYVNLNRMIIVEFNGDYWHSRERVKKKDLYKRAIAESKGFKVIVVWWSDFIKNKPLIIKQCIEKMYESSKSNSNW